MRPPFNCGANSSNVVFTISLIIGFDAETICFAPSANPLNLSCGTAFLTSFKVFLSVFLILFVDLVLAAAACTPLPKIISCPIALNACVSTVENCFFKFSTIGLAFAAVFFNPVCIAPESITCFNSADASDAAF